MSEEKRQTTIKFSPSDWNMFSVTTSNYNKKAIGLFKTCIGRVFDPKNNCWLFPNRCYKFLIELISAYPEFQLESEISESFLKKVFVQTPFDENLEGIFNEMNGFFVPETKLWCFQTSGKSAFEASMLAKEYEIKYEKARPKSILFYYFMYEFYYFSIFSCLQ
jgi:hypothetical protein